MRRAVFVCLVILAAAAALVWLQRRPQPRTPTVVPSPPRPSPAVTRQVTVFLAQETPEADFVLAPVERQVPASGNAAEAALQALVAGPTPAERARGLRATLPDGTRLLGVAVANGVATADFSRELQERFNGGAGWEEVVVYSIVNTLTSIEGVRGVRIRIEGAQVESIGGHVGADEVLESNPDLVGRGSSQ